VLPPSLNRVPCLSFGRYARFIVILLAMVALLLVSGQRPVSGGDAVCPAHQDVERRPAGDSDVLTKLSTPR
jgi:hypothetical protein